VAQLERLAQRFLAIAIHSPWQVQLDDSTKVYITTGISVVGAAIRVSCNTGRRV